MAVPHSHNRKYTECSFVKAHASFIDFKVGVSEDVQTLKRSYLMTYTCNPLINRKIISNVCLIKNSIFRLLGAKVYILIMKEQQL